MNDVRLEAEGNIARVRERCEFARDDVTDRPEVVGAKPERDDADDGGGREPAAQGHPPPVSACGEELVADGVVMREPDGYACDVPADMVRTSIEGALRTVALAALGTLDEEDRRLLEAAACIALEFTAESLAFAIGVDPEDARRRLDRLASAAQVVAWVSPEQADGSSGYGFRDVLSAELLAQSAPMFQQIHVSERLASWRDRRFRRA